MVNFPIHGGPDALGVPDHDFSSNGNPCGPGPQTLQALRSADLTHYPDPSYAALRQALANFHGVAPERIVLAGSASEFIFRITAWSARRGRRQVWYPHRAYADYARAARAWGLTPAAHAASADLIWLCEPSSPEGKGDCRLQGEAGAGQVFVLDRAYEPLRLEGATPWTDDALQRVWQLWTPNKALGLTGVRAAYAVAPEGSVSDVLDLNHLASSWVIGSEGVALLQTWVLPETQRWLQQTLATLRVWKERQMGLCEQLGWSCSSGVANFFVARPTLDRADGPTMELQELLRGLRSRGIKLRDTGTLGMEGHVRLAVLPPASQDALAVAVRAMMMNLETV